MTDPVNILIIDDEEAIQDSCKQVLAREGYKVYFTANSHEGLRIFRIN